MHPARLILLSHRVEKTVEQTIQEPDEITLPEFAQALVNNGVMSGTINGQHLPVGANTESWFWACNLIHEDGQTRAISWAAVVKDPSGLNGHVTSNGQKAWATSPEVWERFLALYPLVTK
jgi:hypothetical protein